MKLLHKTLAAVVCLAFLYALGCVGGYEAGHLSLLGLFARCGAAFAALWGALATRSRAESAGGSDE
jgi:hypothetical protein